MTNVRNRSLDKTPRIYGAENIRRYLQKRKPDYTAGAETSLAGKPHKASREVERRLRQQAKRGEK